MFWPSANAGVAQWQEHLFCKQAVAGSNPIAGSSVSLAMATHFEAVEYFDLSALARRPLPGSVMVAQQILTLFV